MKKYIIALVLCFTGIVFCSQSSAQRRTKLHMRDKPGAPIHSSATGMPSSQSDTALQRFAVTLSYDSLRAYRSDKAFSYIKSLDSLLRHVQRAADTANEGNFETTAAPSPGSPDAEAGNSVFDATPVKIFFWILALGFIGFILHRLFLAGGIFAKSPRENVIAEGQQLETPTGSYDALIYDAVASKDFRLATRYLYLQALQKLAGAGLVRPSPDKTNHEYVKELSGSAHQKKFAHVTLTYEYAWYGKFDISSEIFRKIEGDFKQFYQSLKEG